MTRKQILLDPRWSHFFTKFSEYQAPFWCYVYRFSPPSLLHHYCFVFCTNTCQEAFYLVMFLVLVYRNSRHAQTSSWSHLRPRKSARLRKESQVKVNDALTVQIIYVVFKLAHFMGVYRNTCVCWITPAHQLTLPECTFQSALKFTLREILLKTNCAFQSWV